MSQSPAASTPASAASTDAPPRPRQLRMVLPGLDGLPDAVPPAGYGLRTYRPGDEVAWGEIMSSPAGIGTGWTPELVHERLISRPVFAPDGLFFATADAEGGRPVATTCAWRGSVDETRTGNLHMVCALPEHRGHGLGRLTCLAALHYLRDHGFVAADLSTDDFRLAAIKSYLAMGFVPVYLDDPLSDHQSRWSAIFTRLGARGEARA